jgi:hypothetical protein
MTNNINYNNLVNVDNAASLDKVYWLVEERGLSLNMLQAEVGLDRAKDYCAERLAELKEKCLKAKASGIKRVELEEKAKYWNFIPEWYQDTWFENNSWIWHGEYNYLKMQYRQTKEVLDKLIEELESKAAFEEIIHCGEFGAEEEVEIPTFNDIHWKGAKQNGLSILTEVKYLMHRGTMDENLHVKYIKKIKTAISRREVRACEYYKVMAYLYQYSGFANKVAEAVDKAIELEKKDNYSIKSDVPTANAYSMSMEDAIDLKRQAEAISNRHNISFEEALYSLLEENEEEDIFFTNNASYDTVEDIQGQMAATLS